MDRFFKNEKKPLLVNYYVCSRCGGELRRGFGIGTLVCEECGETYEFETPGKDI